MNKTKEKIIKYLIIILIILSCTTCNAITNSELQKQNEEINSKIEEKSTEIDNVKLQKSNQLKQINELNSNITSYEGKIEELKGNISSLNSDIQEKKLKLEEQENKYVAQKEALEKRLVAMYESGSMSYLDILLSSNGFVDLISNYYLISEIAKADEELLDKIEKTKNEIAEQKTSLESKKVELEESKQELENKKNSLNVAKNEKEKIVNNLSEEETLLLEELEEFKEDRKKIEDQLSRLTSNNNSTIAPSSSGYIFPLKGKTKANITTEYMGYEDHTGADIACSGGTPIMAVKSGTVLISIALKNKDGSYRSYGEYIAIDHQDGTVTIYAHMQAGSRTVQAGNSVEQGQVIGKVGSTGRSTGNHLHFEVRINNGKKHVNPRPYLP